MSAQLPHPRSNPSNNRVFPATQPASAGAWPGAFHLARRTRPLAMGFAFAALAGCAQAPINDADHAPVVVSDPAEPVNRTVFAFNRFVDDYALKPVSQAYGWLPSPVRTGFHNFANNFGEPRIFINDVLQANAGRSMNTLGRFTVNTTFGLLGLIDVATPMGLPRHDADFGQTFGVWGIANGPIVEMPLLGTGNARDAVGRVLSFVVDPLGVIDSNVVETITAVRGPAGIIDGRYEALPVTDRLEQQPDYYVSMRDGIAVRRAKMVIQGRRGEVQESSAPEVVSVP